jgi:uncharacterized protein (TIGR03067 family)
MKLQWAAAFVCVVIGSIVWADDKATPDKEKLEGTWKMVSGKRGDQPLPAEAIGTLVTFKGDKMSMKRGDMTITWPFTLDATKKPKEITVDMDGKPGKGIYELQGDTLKIAHGEEGDPRPMDFKGGGKISIIVLKREKADK